MKLISEEVQNAEYIVEEKNGKKEHKIKGVFLQSEIKNRNGRVYPEAILAREVYRYNKEFINKNRAFGELGHPDGPTVNLDRVSHMVTKLYPDGKNFMGEAKIMDTPMGRIVKSLIDEGAQLGVSSRGMGTLKQNGEANEVQGDFTLATAADIVADPSAPEAFVQGVMEGVEWLNVDDRWVPKYIEQTQKEIKEAKLGDLREKKIRAFEKFLKQL